MQRNPLALEAHFGERIFAIRNAGGSAEEVSRKLGNLLGEIDTHVANVHIEHDYDALAAWEAARDFVRREIS
jgi:hypothetical protein